MKCCECGVEVEQGAEVWSVDQCEPFCEECAEHRCWKCGGSGEGYTKGTKCTACAGRGIVRYWYEAK